MNVDSLLDLRSSYLYFSSVALLAVSVLGGQAQAGQGGRLPQRLLKTGHGGLCIGFFLACLLFVEFVIIREHVDLAEDHSPPRVS
jgi:hypothetical protein